MSGDTEMNIAELAREQAELLPERMTLAAIEMNRTEFDPSIYTVDSPGSNNAYTENHSEPQVAFGNGSIIQSVVNGWNNIEQW